MSLSTQKFFPRSSSWLRCLSGDLTSFASLKNQKILSGLVSVGFLLLTLDIIILISHQPIGYLIDIYSALPEHFYLILILCFLIASVVLLGGSNQNRKLSILLLILTQITILIIPYMLGYYSMGRSDDMTYIGEFVQIAKSGNVAGWDIYPASLILGAISSIISGLEANQVAFIIPIFFSFMFTVGLILCCRTITTDRFFSDIAILSSFILYLGSFNFANTPNALFFAFMPMFVYVVFRYVKARTLSNTTILIIMTILMPFTHPFIFFFVFSFLSLLILLNPILQKLNDVNYRTLARPLLIMLTGFLAWFIYCDVLFAEFRRSYFAYLARASQTVLNETVGKLSIVDFDIFDIFKLLLLYYGRYFIPAIIIIFALIFVILKKDRISNEMKKKLKFLSILYLICLFLEGVLVINPLISHTPDRISNLNFIVIAQVPLFAYSILILFPHSWNVKKAIFNFAIVILIIASTWGLSLYGTFNSPNTFLPSAALTYNEVNSMRWFYESRIDISVTAPTSQMERFHDLFDDGGHDNIILIADHFGYNSTQIQFSEASLKKGQQTYIIIPTVDELLYQDVPGYSHVGRYTGNDFSRFRTDPTVDKVFNGLNIEIYQSARW